MPPTCPPTADLAPRPHGALWAAGLTGLFLLVFCVAALSGPGRIDIADGQARFEAARNLVDHGDDNVRDPRVWFGVFPGRGERLYTAYRLPQIVMGAAAVGLADVTGTSTEARRHFFFVLTSAAAGGLLAVAYAVLFRHLGHQPANALLWALGGILCTPSWYYATSTFDDILGATAIVWAVTVALLTRANRPLLGAAIAGLLVGLAFHCKQPLGVFVLVVLAAHLDPRLTFRHQWRQVTLVLAGLLFGILLYKGYDLYKFPPGSTAAHAELLAEYAPNFPGNPLAALLGMSLSPAAGALWYCPPVIIAALGIRSWYRRDERFCLTIMAASAIFVIFLSALTIFKGDPAWGPRYLTPVFALWWLFVPAGAKMLRCQKGLGPKLVPTLLTAGVMVQLAGLSVDPHRLYVERQLPSAFCVVRPWLYFHPAVSHLINRPREIVEVCRPGRPRSESFTPAPATTFALPIIDRMACGREAVQSYHVFNSLRPWWVSQRYLPPGERPVDIACTAGLLLLGVLGGLLMLSLTLLNRTTNEHELTRIGIHHLSTATTRGPEY